MSQAVVKPRRRYFRFGPRTMFVVVAIASLTFGLGWFGGRAHLRSQQAEENAALEKEVFGDPFEEEVTDSKWEVNSSTPPEDPVRAERARLQFEKTLDKGDWGSPLSHGSRFF